MDKLIHKLKELQMEINESISKEEEEKADQMYRKYWNLLYQKNSKQMIAAAEDKIVTGRFLEPVFLNTLEEIRRDLSVKDPDGTFAVEDDEL